MSENNRRLERRVTGPVELRATRANGTVTLEGYAALLNVWSVDLGGFRERILPGFFAPALRRPDNARFLVNHRDLPLATVGAEDLELEEDDTGLAFTATLEADDPDVDRVVRKIKPKKLDQMSFAFTMPEDGSGERLYKEEGEWRRDLILIDELWDVSVVTYAAYPDTSVALRSLARARGELVPGRIDVDVRRRDLELAVARARAEGLVG